MGTKSEKKKATKTPKPATEKRGRGRPPVNPPDFTERFMIRTTPTDLENWRAAAAKRGLNVAPWLRMIANNEIAKLEKAAS